MYFVRNVCNRAFVYLKMGAMRLMHSSYVISALEYSMTIAHIGGGHGPLAPHSPAVSGSLVERTDTRISSPWADLAKTVPASRDLPDRDPHVGGDVSKRRIVIRTHKGRDSATGVADHNLALC